MFTGSAEQMREHQARVLQAAQEVAALLTRLEAEGLGPAQGQIRFPGAIVQKRDGENWTAE
ncbi:hypothetical protein [Streptomyces sp. A1547]|uniref:hypothetical protein n=1 Tax=Streptomyces sp. A1547 TaxID=2563105 RepID=UPI00109EA388|nr:hypothetical protein [Streptomyces sp. A1547]THA28474.1 hypothetical protein E6W17_41010 [Streptomyces sp. A1547]